MITKNKEGKKKKKKKKDDSSCPESVRRSCQHVA